MASRRPPASTDGTPGADDAPATQTGAAFDAAQGLLQAALDEVRGLGVGPPKPPVPPATAKPPTEGPPAASRPGPTTRPAPAEAEVLLRAAIADVHGDDARPDGPAEVPAAAAAASQISSPRRRRRPTPASPKAPKAPKAPAAPTAPATATAPDPGDDDGLTDSVFESRGQRSRRQRRTVAPEMGVAAVASDAGTTASVEPAPADSTAVHAAPAAPVDPTPVEPVEVAVAAAAAAEAAAVVGPARAVPQTAAAPLVDPQRSQDRNRRRGYVAVAAALVLALVVGLFVVLGGGESDEPALRASGQARFTFPTTTTPDGAEVTRVWTLRGDRGSEFVGLLEIANPTSAPLPTTVTEVIPKSLAATTDDIEFDPQPKVIQADPVVEYSVVIPAAQTFTARYTIEVSPDGARRERLETWAQELDTTTTTTTTPAPTVTTAPAPPPTQEPSRPPATTVAPTTPTTPPLPPPTDPPPPVETATIVIQVISRGGTGTFDYSGSAGGVSLTTFGEPHGSASWSLTVTPGTYTMTQTGTPAFWYLVSVSCSGSSSGANPTATFNVAAGETSVCTFENRPA